MSAVPDLPGREIQRLILNDPPRGHVMHAIVTFPEQAGCGRSFLRRLIGRVPLTPADASRQGAVHASLGFSYRGLERLQVPAPVLGQFQLRAPAFTAGALLRAAQHLGDTGPSAATRWDPCFALDTAHAVFTLHAMTQKAMAPLEKRLRRLAAVCHVKLHLLRGDHIGAPAGEKGQWVHFGFRDGLSRVAVRGWPAAHPTHAVSEHEAGEFLLGRINDHRFNPWLLPSAHKDVRRFFRDGSFAVVRQMEQDVSGFHNWVQERAMWLRGRFPKPAEGAAALAAAKSASPTTPQPSSWSDYVKAKVCGRWPDGRRITRGPGWCEPGTEGAEADFDYAHDPEGLGCPFGSHARRMNPRLPSKVPNSQAAGDVVHSRQRPLIRRGHPYGPLWSAPGDGAEPAVPDDTPRGLLGLFFCASLEDQFEHLLGQWAERPVLGVDDRGDAKDPLMGQHDDPESRFHIPLPDRQSVDLLGLRAFVRTRGTLYLFHPSLPALKLMLDNPRFFDLPEAPLEP